MFPLLTRTNYFYNHIMHGLGFSLWFSLHFLDENYSVMLRVVQSSVLRLYCLNASRLSSKVTWVKLSELNAKKLTPVQCVNYCGWNKVNNSPINYHTQYKFRCLEIVTDKKWPWLHGNIFWSRRNKQVGINKTNKTGVMTVNLKNLTSLLAGLFLVYSAGMKDYHGTRAQELLLKMASTEKKIWKKEAKMAHFWGTITHITQHPLCHPPICMLIFS